MLDLTTKNNHCKRAKSLKMCLRNTVKLGFKEQLNKEQLHNSERFPVTNMPVHLINNEKIAFSEQLCNDQKVSYYQV